MDELFRPTSARIVNRGGLYGLLSGATIGALGMTELAAAVGTPLAALLYDPFAAIVGGVVGAFLGGLVAALVASLTERSAHGEIRPATAARVAAALSALGSGLGAIGVGGATGWPPDQPFAWWLGVVLAATAAGAVCGPALVAPDRRPVAVAHRLYGAAVLDGSAR